MMKNKKLQFSLIQAILWTLGLLAARVLVVVIYRELPTLFDPFYLAHNLMDNRLETIFLEIMPICLYVIVVLVFFLGNRVVSGYFELTKRDINLIILSLVVAIIAKECIGRAIGYLYTLISNMILALPEQIKISNSGVVWINASKENFVYTMTVAVVMSALQAFVFGLIIKIFLQKRENDSIQWYARSIIPAMIISCVVVSVLLMAVDMQCDQCLVENYNLKNIIGQVTLLIVMAVVYWCRLIFEKPNDFGE